MRLSRGGGGDVVENMCPMERRARVKHQEFQITWMEHILQELCASNNKHISPPPQDLPRHDSTFGWWWTTTTTRRRTRTSRRRRSSQSSRRNPRNYARMAPECVICSVPSCSDTDDDNVNIFLGIATGLSQWHGTTRRGRATLPKTVKF